MSSSDINPETATPPPPRRNGLVVLLVIAVIALIGVNGWMAYQTWQLNQTLSQFAAQRGAAALVNDAFPADGSVDAGAQGQRATGFGRQRGQAAAGVATEVAAAGATEGAAELNPAPANAPVGPPAAGDLPGKPGAAPAGSTQDNSAAVAIGVTPSARGSRDVRAVSARAVETDTSAMPPMPALPGGDAELAAPPGEPAATPPDGIGTTTDTTGAAVASTAPAESAAVVVASIPIVTGVKGVQMWDDSGNLLMSYDSGVTLSATGRSPDGEWLIVESAAGPGWVQTKQVIAYGVQQLAAAPLPPSTALAPTRGIEGAAAAVGAPAVSALAAVTGTLAGASEAAAPEASRGLVTPTPEGSAAPEVSASVTAVTATVVISDARLNVRSGPGLDYPIIGKASPGAIYVVTGRNRTGEWLQVRLDEGNDITGWVDAIYLKVSGNIDTLPEPAVPPAIPGTSTTINGPAEASAGPISIQTLGATSADTGLRGTIVFQQSQGGEIYAYLPATGVLRPLTHGFDPAISPDGSTVAFTRDGGESGLYLVDVDGSNERQIFVRPSLSSPKWSPDGRWILFSRNDDYSECYAVGFNQCLAPELFFKRFPNAPSDQFPLVKEYQRILSAVDFDGQNFHDIPALDSARAPDWSEGGIVYQSKAGIQRTADGPNTTTEEVAFDNLNPYYFDPDWQPNGGQIAFQLKGAAQTDIWVVNPDGAGLHPLTAPATALVDQMPSNVAPAYSPDGAHIVFLSNRDERNSAGAWRMWVMDADGSNQRRLPIDVPIDYSFGLEQAVSWGG